MFKDVRTWLIIGLAAVIVWLLLFRSSPPDPERQTYIDSVKVLQTQKAAIQALQDTIILKARLREKKDSANLATKEKEIARLKAKAVTAVQNIPVRVMEENPEIGYALAAKDDVIEKQAVLIDTLKNQLAFERGVRENLVALHYDQAKIESQMSELKDIRIVNLEKDLKKEKQKGRFARVLIPVALVGGFLLGAQ